MFKWRRLPLEDQNRRVTDLWLRGIHAVGFVGLGLLFNFLGHLFLLLLELGKPLVVSLGHEANKQWVIPELGVFIQPVQQPLEALLPPKNKGALKPPKGLLARDRGHEAPGKLLGEVVSQPHELIVPPSDLHSGLFMGHQIRSVLIQPISHLFRICQTNLSLWHNLPDLQGFS